MKINTFQLPTGAVSVPGEGMGLYHNLASLHFDLGILLDGLEENLGIESEEVLHIEKSCDIIELEGTRIGEFIKTIK